MISFVTSGTGPVRPLGWCLLGSWPYTRDHDPMGSNPSTGGTVTFDFGGGKRFKRAAEVFSFPQNAFVSSFHPESAITSAGREFLRAPSG